VDWNNDGKLDLVAGNSAGTVFVYLNIGTSKKPKLAKGIQVEAGGKKITPTRKTYKKVNDKYEVDKEFVGSHKLADSYSKVHMADWDDDGLKDLLIGHNNTVVFYKNAGTKKAPKFKEPVVIKVTGSLPSRPSPYVVDWDKDGKKDLLMGCEQSKVLFYRNTGTNKKPKLEEAKDLGLRAPGFTTGYRCRIDVTDWNKDGKLDILVGNFGKRTTDDSKRNYGGNIWLFLGK